jgi:methyl-accepting chemotaxis protein
MCGREWPRLPLIFGKIAAYDRTPFDAAHQRSSMIIGKTSIEQRLWRHSGLLLLLIAIVTAAAGFGAGDVAVVVLGAVALLVGIVATVLTTRSVTRPLAHAVQVARQVATGDLFNRIEPRRAVEAKELFDALRGMIRSLKQIALNVRHSVDAIHSATREITVGNNDLSQRTVEQASSLEETASSMEQLTSIVRHNAQSCDRAADLAGNAVNVATRSGDVANRIVATMDGITESARRIVDVIGVIENIAFQTNILALNASVEAARAGEQGRGFAVVAGEVRGLAQRSAEAAREIKVLIDNSVTRIDEGATLVKQAGTTINDLAGTVNEVSEVIGEIATASNEQRAGIEQVNDVIMQMDAATQQNAGLVEQVAAAAAALDEQASRLGAAVRALRIDGADAAVVAQALVKQAITYLKEHGRERAFAAYHDAKSGFVQGDLYVVVYDMSGNNLAHGANAQARGKNLLDAQDADGKYYMRERIALARDNESFWQDYKYLNPVTRQIEAKSSYFERLNDLIVGCGIYK